MPQWHALAGRGSSVHAAAAGEVQLSRGNFSFVFQNSLYYKKLHAKLKSVAVRCKSVAVRCHGALTPYGALPIQPVCGQVRPTEGAGLAAVFSLRAAAAAAPGPRLTSLPVQDYYFVSKWQ